MGGPLLPSSLVTTRPPEATGLVTEVTRLLVAELARRLSTSSRSLPLCVCLLPLTS